MKFKYVRPDKLYVGGIANNDENCFCAMEWINYAKAGYNFSVLMESADGDATALAEASLVGIPSLMGHIIVEINDKFGAPLDILEPFMKKIIETSYEKYELTKEEDELLKSWYPNIKEEDLPAIIQELCNIHERHTT